MSEVFNPSALSLKSQRFYSMIMFIQRHKIEARLGNLNPDPTISDIPRYIHIGSEEHKTYMLLNKTHQIIPVK